MRRKLFIAGAATALAGCGPIGTALNDNAAVRGVLASAESLDYALISGHRLAREYPASAIAPVFRVNGFATPADDAYRALLASNFATYRLVVGGLVDRPLSLSLRDIARYPQVSQITRHDCVEGWSVIGQWSGVRLGTVLDSALPRRAARFVVFSCMDDDGTGRHYYESLDVFQAHHPQTLLATGLNGRPLDPDHGAPVRLRIPTQLGYKSAKWIRRIDVVSALAGIGGGRGGYWEDQDYEWYAGI